MKGSKRKVWEEIVQNSSPQCYHLIISLQQGGSNMCQMELLCLQKTKTLVMLGTDFIQHVTELLNVKEICALYLIHSKATRKVMVLSIQFCVLIQAVIATEKQMSDERAITRQ